jgi:peptidyl-prolyl cis-trans isomerase A (cyclophilin A)
MPGMDAHPEAAGDNQGFAVFAHVVDGMDAVRAILVAPKSATAGEGVMKGQMLDQPVTILTARRLP